MICELQIPEGSTAIIGAPAQPMRPEIEDALRNIVSTLPGIREAHTPQCFVLGVSDESRQVLVLVLDGTAEREDIAGPLCDCLEATAIKPERIDIIFMEPNDSLLSAVRSTNCRIFSAATEGSSYGSA